MTLKPLVGMPLEFLSLRVHRSVDLKPLKQLPNLKELQLTIFHEIDMTPLAELQIERLKLVEMPANDLSAIASLKLKALHVSKRLSEQDIAIVKSMKSLKSITLRQENLTLDLIDALPNLKMVGTHRGYDESTVVSVEEYRQRLAGEAN
jgi:hypothetical protein